MRALLILGLFALPSIALAQNATTPGTSATPHPTLEHLSIDWAIDGDANANGVVSVRFREEGTASWREGMALRRIPADTTPEGFSWTNRHAGSLFGLRPDTAYEIELALNDPDGGSETRVVNARTRPVPTVPATATMVPVTPDTIAAALSSAAPGDVLVLAAGTYASIQVANDGAEGMPIVVRGSAVDDVIIDGEVRMDGTAHVWIEDLTVRGQIKFNDAIAPVVRGCHIEAMTSTGDGIVSYGTGSTDGYFADNVVIGRTVWAESSLGVSGDNIGEGIVMTGPGNVIEHNRVVGFRDCISLLEDTSAVDQISIDILGNDLESCADDAIEADFSMGNVRVMRNRMINSFIGMSSQPSLGGPTYFIRNVEFNVVYQAFKPQRSSVGDVWLHNTVVKPGDAMGVYTSDTWSRALFRNNLLIGGADGGDYGGYSNGSGDVLAISTVDAATSDFDYDGYGSIGTGAFSGQLGSIRFSSLAELRSGTTEVHAVEVDLSVFAASFDFPDTPFPGLTAPDLRLTEGAAVDAGEPIPNVNDAFAGAAPDLGAYELGSGAPLYGPRTGAPVCGNGVVETGETCDDSNTTAGDGCNASCLIEVGDGGVVLPDGGMVSRDGGTSADGGPGVVEGGCGCRAGSRAGHGWFLAVLGMLAAARLRRLRRAPGRAGIRGATDREIAQEEQK